MENNRNRGKKVRPIDEAISYEDKNKKYKKNTDENINSKSRKDLSDNGNIKSKENTDDRRKRKHKKRWPKVLITIVIVIGILLGCVYGLAKMLLSGGPGVDMITKMLGKEVRGDEPVYVLALGVNPPLSDAIMLIGYNPPTGQVSILSIPRDTYIPKVTTNKINAIYSTNGGYNKNKKDADYEKAEKAMLSKVEEITGIYADYYITVDTKALREIVDTVGGVTVDVPINMKYDDSTQNLHINLKKGTQTLNGKKAEQFVRFRKNNNGTGYPNGDIGRIQTQQQFMKALATQVLKAQNLTKIPDFIKIGLDNVKTNIEVGDALQYVDDVKNFKMENLRMETLPAEEDPKKLAKYKNVNQACYFWDEDKTKELCEDLFFENKNNEPQTEENNSENNEKEIRVELLNGSSNSKALNKLTEKLKKEGYNVVKVGKTKTTSKSKIIIRKDTNKIDDLKKIINTKNTQTDKDENSDIHYTIIIGNDYR